MADYKGWQVQVKRQFWPSDEEDDEEWPRSHFSGMAYHIRVGEIGTLLGSLYNGYWGNAATLSMRPSRRRWSAPR